MAFRPKMKIRTKENPELFKNFFEKRDVYTGNSTSNENLWAAWQDSKSILNSGSEDNDKYNRKSELTLENLSLYLLIK